MTAPLTFTQPNPGGRILLMLGQHEAGAIFPPCRDDHSPLAPWCWRFWLGSPTAVCPEGHTKTELAAKNALLAQAKDWLTKAGIE